MSIQPVKLLLKLAMVGAIGFVFAPSVRAQSCTAAILGGSSFAGIQLAINAASVNGATILVSGVCTESISVNEHKHRLTIDGSGGGAGTKATINSGDPTASTVFIAGNGITFRNFVVNGGTAGILVTRGGTAIITDNTVQGARSGINVNTSGSARITGNLLQNNLHSGIIVQESASARIGYSGSDDITASPNTIQLNGQSGIHVVATGNAGIIGNIISANSLHGIEVARGSQAEISANVIDANTGNGIFVSENSGVNLGDARGNTPLFELSNDTVVKNGGRGIECEVGGYVAGRLGTLDGKQKPKFSQGCIDKLVP